MLEPEALLAAPQSPPADEHHARTEPRDRPATPPD